MPILLYQVYAYVLPAFSPRAPASSCRSCSLSRSSSSPASPCYFVVMPVAVEFLLGFNDTQFNVQVRARDYYSFFSTTLLAGGIVFQLPLAILAVTRLGIVRVEQLSKNRRYAYLAIAVVAAALPGRRPGLDVIEMVPLLAPLRVEYLDRSRLWHAEGGGRNGKALNPGADSSWQNGERRMLFDTAGRRRHVVRVVYAILALLMGAASSSSSAPSTSPTCRRRRRDQRQQGPQGTGRTDEAQTAAEPDDEDAAALPDPHPDAAGNALTEVNPETGATRLHAGRRAGTRRASEAWDRYLKQTEEPKPSAALLMAGSYFSLAETPSSTKPRTTSKAAEPSDRRRGAAQRRLAHHPGDLRVLRRQLRRRRQGRKKAEGKAPPRRKRKKSTNSWPSSASAAKPCKQKKEFAKQEREPGQRSPAKPLGGLSGGGGALGE